MFVGRSAKYLMCVALLSGAFTAAHAQDDNNDDPYGLYTQVDTPKVAKNLMPTFATKEVRGVVKDAAGKSPMGGVRVEALGNPLYTSMTEDDGSFTIKVPLFTSILYVKTEGYNGLQLPISSDKGLEALMYRDWFGNNYENAISILHSDKARVVNPTSLAVDGELSNKLNASVRTITRGGIPAQGAAMFINGITSLNAIAQPLVVVDGVIWDMQYDRTTLHDGFYNNVLSMIDVDDIETIEVLRNGTSLYGARGANGVLVINTKRSKSMVTRIRANIFGGFETKPSTIDMMNGSQYRNYLTGFLGTTASAEQLAAGNSTFMNENPSYLFYPLYHNNTDWSSDLYNSTAFTQSYKVVVEGGDDVAKYNLSLGYTKADATAKKNDFDRLNIRFNTDVNVFRNVETSLDIAYSRVVYSIFDNGWAESYTQRNISSPNVLGLIQFPIINKYEQFVVWDVNTMQNTLVLSENVYSGRTYTDTYNPFRMFEGYGYAALANPYWILQNGEGTNKNNQEQSQFSLNFAPRYTVNRYLAIGNRFYYSMNRANEKYYLPYNGTPSKTVEGLGAITSTIASQFSKSTTVFNDLYATYKRQFGMHGLDATAGVRFTAFTFNDNYVRGYNNTNDKMPNISYSLQYLAQGGNDDRWNNLAYYVDANYNYMQRYFAKFTTSVEASSRFGKEADSGIKLFGVRWGIFPSLQLGWLVTSEPWFNSSKINSLKVTLGYDESGNDNIDYYAARTYFVNTKFLDRATALALGNVQNAKIQWETNRRLSLGIESRMFDNRLLLGLDMYYSKTVNMLTKKDPGYATGLSTVWTNDGAMRNIGLNASVTGIIVNSKNWRWQAGATLGTYQNRITALPSPTSEGDLTNTIRNYALDANGQQTGTPNVINGYTSSVYGTNNILTAVGYSAGVFYGYQTKGVFASDAEASSAGTYGYLRMPTGLTAQPYREFKGGDVHFVDQNGDGWISDADRVVIGDANPDLFGNIFTTIGWKSLTLDVNFKYSLGNDVFNYQRSQLESGNGVYNQTTAMVNRWTYQGQVTDVPRAMATTNDQWVNNERFSDRWIEDGSFLKLKRIRLTYDVPLRPGFIQGLAIWGEANNVFTITKYLGTDPEVTAGNSVLYQGIDTGLLSQGRNFNLGLSINL